MKLLPLLLMLASAAAQQAYTVALLTNYSRPVVWPSYLRIGQHDSLAFAFNRSRFSLVLGQPGYCVQASGDSPVNAVSQHTVNDSTTVTYGFGQPGVLGYYFTNSSYEPGGDACFDMNLIGAVRIGGVSAAARTAVPLGVLFLSLLAG